MLLQMPRHCKAWESDLEVLLAPREIWRDKGCMLAPLLIVWICLLYITTIYLDVLYGFI